MSAPVPTLPAGVLAFAARGPDWGSFVNRLPALTRDLLTEWELTVDGAARHGYCALVLPVLTSSGGPATLKIAFPDDESEHEYLAMQHWHGNGAARLLRADPRRSAMLLERLHEQDLMGVWDLEACEIVAGLYARIHVPAPPQLRTVTSYVERWAADLAELPATAPIPRRLVEQAISLSGNFVTDPASIGTMIHGDLHYENVLAGDREPWLVIDPKPMSGDPHYEPAPMLWNRFEELAGDVRGGIRRRFHTLVDTAGFDEDRARDWVVVRMIENAMWALQDAARERRGRSTIPGGAGLTASEQEWVTICITIAKAVQD